MEIGLGRMVRIEGFLKVNAYPFIQMANSIQALLQQLESTSGKKEWLIRTKAVKKGPFDKYE